jgi:Leucine carboxyl methyltransferase
MSQIFPNYNSIVRTATDSLLAKYSAIVTVGYSPNFNTDPSNGPGDHCGDDILEKTSPTKVDSMSTYKVLLQSMTEYYAVSNAKRQSPLLNAGYAIRIACVLRQVESFVAFHRHCKTNCPVQIIIPGCGLDVTGLWCLSLLRDEMGIATTPDFSIHVVEIDFPSICESKGQAIRTKHLVDHVESDASLSTGAHCTLSMRNGYSRYSLVSANLEDSALMDEIFSDSVLLNVNLPTFVLSELVLAYLSIERRNTLLRRMASLFRCRGSCTTMYEPLGSRFDEFFDSSTDRECSVAPLPVLESYKSSYCNLFNAKLQQGLATPQQQSKDSTENHSPEDHSSSRRFFPLGSSTNDVDQRLLSLGYEYVFSSVSGRVVSWMDFMDWRAKELFDEHAALTLHLCSYVLVCAFRKANSDSIQYERFGTTTENIDTCLFRRFMCPWMSSTGLMQCPVPIRTPRISSYCWITNIEKEDEKQVRCLFSDTYKGLSDEYISIRKMVKTALRKDLGSSDGSDALRFCNSSGCIPVSSTIGKCYQELGGDFVVAVQYSNLRDSALSSDGGFAKKENDLLRQVLGAIGIRRCTVEEYAARRIPSNAICYEIHRFFVDNHCRARGTGTGLFRQVLGAIHSRHRHDSSKLCYVIATTPTVLVSATHFYTKHEFDILNESEIGGLTMRTYIRKL